jgi:hypothetical protein
MAEGKVQRVGIAWIDKRNYARIRELSVDRDRLPATHDEWLRIAEKTEAQLIADGQRVVRVELDPVRFVTWCQRNNCQIDGKARVGFAAEGARRVLDN